LTIFNLKLENWVGFTAQDVTKQCIAYKECTNEY